MSLEFARDLYVTGRAHSLSTGLLHDASVDFAKRNGMADPIHFAFNGTFSLSLFNLMGLGIELLLKAAYVFHSGNSDPRDLRTKIGHDLVSALILAEENGFSSDAPNLRSIVEQLREPYLQHWFRYQRPDQIALPDTIQVIEMLATLDEELNILIGQG